jgi:hypothetical protein
VIIGATNTAEIYVHESFELNGSNLFVNANIGSASSVYSSGDFVAAGQMFSGVETYFGNGFVARKEGSLDITTTGISVQPSINIFAGPRASGSGGDVNIRAGNGNGGSPGGNIVLTPGDSLGQPGHVYITPTSTSNQTQLRFTSIGGGYTSLEAANTAATFNMVLPTVSGASNTVLATNGSGGLSFISVCLSDGSGCSETLATVRRIYEP